MHEKVRVLLFSHATRRVCMYDSSLQATKLRTLAPFLQPTFTWFVFVFLFLWILFSLISTEGPQAMIRGAIMYGGLMYLLSGNLTEKKQPFQYMEETIDF